MRDVVDAFANNGIKYKVVYCTEAHPTDGWMNQFAPAQFKNVAYAQTIDERLRVARTFARSCGVADTDVIVDGIGDELERAYEARPERLYVVGGGNVLWRCGPGPWEYDVAGLTAFLQAYA